jgi:hypothetical protein
VLEDGLLSGSTALYSFLVDRNLIIGQDAKQHGLQEMADNLLTSVLVSIGDLDDVRNRPYAD